MLHGGYEPDIVYRTCPTTGCFAFIPYRMQHAGAIATPGYCHICAERSEPIQPEPLDRDVRAELAAFIVGTHVVAFAQPRRHRRQRQARSSRHAAC